MVLAGWIDLRMVRGIRETEGLLAGKARRRSDQARRGVIGIATGDLVEEVVQVLLSADERFAIQGLPAAQRETDAIVSS